MKIEPILPLRTEGTRAKERRDMGYDELDEQKEGREDLLDQIREIMEGVERDRSGGFEKDLGQHLNEWFTVHFRTRDARLRRSLSSLEG